MFRKLLCSIVLAVAVGPISCLPVSSEDLVRELVEAAERSARPQPWARLLIRADAEATKLERRKRGNPGPIRSVKTAGGIVLQYRWNEIQQSENYEHNLLRRVVRALVKLYPTILSRRSDPEMRVRLAKL